MSPLTIRTLIAVALLSVLVSVGACGQKGDLYLPDDPARAASRLQR
jgi:predicted small lipoprotein YifL